MSRLFSPLSIGTLQLANRIVIAPMCQYSAEDGNATDWHMIHLGQLALSGAGMLIPEASAVSPRGASRPTTGPVQRRQRRGAGARAARGARLCADRGVDPAGARRTQGIQPRARQGGSQIRPDEPLGWKTVAPSAVPHAEEKTRRMR